MLFFVNNIAKFSGLLLFIRSSCSRRNIYDGIKICWSSARFSFCYCEIINKYLKYFGSKILTEFSFQMGFKRKYNISFRVGGNERPLILRVLRWKSHNWWNFDNYYISTENFACIFTCVSRIKCIISFRFKLLSINDKEIHMFEMET